METQSQVQEIDIIRKEFLTQFSNKHGGVKHMVYVGQLSPDDISEDGMKQMQKNIKGTERFIEYHLFETLNTKIPMMCQWRMM